MIKWFYLPVIIRVWVIIIRIWIIVWIHIWVRVIVISSVSFRPLQYAFNFLTLISFTWCTDPLRDYYLVNLIGWKQILAKLMADGMVTSAIKVSIKKTYQNNSCIVEKIGRLMGKSIIRVVPTLMWFRAYNIIAMWSGFESAIRFWALNILL